MHIDSPPTFLYFPPTSLLPTFLPPPSQAPQTPSPLLRLQDGDTQWDGRLEILHNKQWGTICDTHWSLQDADVCDLAYCILIVCCNSILILYTVIAYCIL